MTHPETGPITVHTPAPMERLESLLLFEAADGSGESFIPPAVAALAEDPGEVCSLGFDCFYGWAEPRMTDAEREVEHVKGECKPHNMIQLMIYSDAADVARCLIEDGHEVVLTTTGDWSEKIGNAPIFYKSTHEH